MQVRVKNPSSERLGEQGTANREDWQGDGFWIRVVIGAHRCMFHRNNLELVSSFDPSRGKPNWTELWV